MPSHAERCAPSHGAAGGLALLVFMTFWGVWVLAIGFRMSLVMLGATGAAPRGPSAPGGL